LTKVHDFERRVGFYRNRQRYEAVQKVALNPYWSIKARGQTIHPFLMETGPADDDG